MGIENYHRKLLEILGAHSLTGSSSARRAGHMAIRALIQEIHDDGYVLGQLGAIQKEVAELKQRLGIDQLKQVQTLKDDLKAIGHLAAPDIRAMAEEVVALAEAEDPARRGMNLLQAVEQEAERLRNQYRMEGGELGLEYQPDRDGTD